MRRTGPRAHGPYKHGDRWRIHIVTSRGGTRSTRYESFDTRAEADAAIEAARDEKQGVTVSQAIEAWLDSKRARGRPEVTISTYRDMLARILGSVMSRPVRYIAGRGAELYAAARVYPDGHAKAGQARAVDTHRNSLGRARDFGRFCTKQKWLRANPFADVEPVGARVVGADKVTLSTDESRRLEAWCIAHGTNQHAVLTLAYLYLGTRASELWKRNVRDIDDAGTVLRVGKTKTAAGRRHFRLPDVLRDLLADLVRDKAPDDPIFTNELGARMGRTTAWERVREVCQAAGVGAIGPQAIRRTSASVAAEAGEMPLAIARHLGHATGDAPAVTTRSYVSRDAATTSSIERRLRVLQGGRR